MKVNELIYDVREAIKEYTDDGEIDDRYIIYLYNIKRVKYLRQDLNSFQKTIDNSILQSLCIGLEEVSGNECSIPYDCSRIMRTKQKIPTTIELHTKTGITKVKPTTRLAIPFSFITKDKAAFLEGATFQNELYSFLDNDEYIYVISPGDNAYKLLTCITITGIFEDPLELGEYSNCCDCTPDESPCFDELESEYPLQPHYIDIIRKEIIAELIAVKQVPEDRTNNSDDL